MIEHHRYLIGNLRLPSAIVDNLQKIFGKCSKNIRRRSPSLRNNFGKSSEIFGKCSEIFGKTSKTSLLVAKLQRAKRASEAPWVRKIGNPSSRENLVMTSAYERANVRTYVRPSRLWGRGGASRDLPHRHPYRKLRNAIFPWRFFVEKSEKHSFLFAMSTNDRRG